MEYFCTRFLTEDAPAQGKGISADYGTIKLNIFGSEIYGQIMWGTYDPGERRPAVIFHHGFPGSARNDDIAHALCRMGCVVMTPHHRGAWGSGGKYLVSGCIEDSLEIARQVSEEDFAAKYGIDPDNIFLIGHSMGGNTVLNSAKRNDRIKGIVMMAPYDPAHYLRGGSTAELRALVASEMCALNSDGPDAIFDDIVEHGDDMSFTEAFDKMKDRNILILAGALDPISPYEAMVKPLWEMLKKHETNAVQRAKLYPEGHGLIGCRCEIIREIADFMHECYYK